tara:strand:- start:374 stop:1210 length:837 start_codon:yes stop_codon:yes gene_type:complete
MNKNKIHFFTFGDSNFTIQKKHLSKLAEYSGFFDKIYAYSPKDIDKKFYKNYKVILNQKRGAGYWLWKYYFTNKIIENSKKGDIVIYLDAGSSINFHAKKRYKQYLDILNSSDLGSLSFKEMEQNSEFKWTNKEILSYFKCENDKTLLNTPQINASVLIFKNNEHTNDYLEEFIKTINYDPYLITDKYAKNQNDGFIENRHDQSISSVIKKIHGTHLLENENQFQEKPEKQYDFPFLTVRRKGYGFRDKLNFNLFPDKFGKEIQYFDTSKQLRFKHNR